MGIFKRTFVSITQRYGKSIILFLIVFIIANIIGASITIKEATSNVEKNMKEQLGAYATVEFNTEYYNTAGEDFVIEDSLFSRNKAEKIGQSPYVRDYAYGMALIVGSNNMKAAETQGNFNAAIGAEDSNLFSFSLVSENADLPTNARNKKIELVDGKFPAKEESNTMTISESLALANNLKVGDEVDLVYGVLDMYGDSIQMNSTNFAKEITKKFKIVGIYKHSNVEQLSETDKMMVEFEKNTIYTSNKTIGDIDLEAATALQDLHGGELDKYMTTVLPSYILNSVDDIDAFVKENEDIIPKGFKLVTAKDNYEQVASSITNMNLISKNVYVFGIIVSIIILSLVVIIMLRERKTEFGIYQALGETRLKTLSQIALELILITILGTSLAIFSSGKIASTISTKMIDNQISSDTSDNEMGMVILGGSSFDKPEISVDDVVENFNIDLSSEFIITLYTVMIITSTAASSVAMLYMLRQKPREILL